jgi:CRP-like cAMP-binding protein
MNSKRHNLIMSAWSEQSVDIFDRIETHAQLRKAKNNEVLLSQGEAVNNIWFILRGRASAFAYSRSGQKVWISDILPGDMFGHAYVLANVPPGLQIVSNSDLQYLSLAPSELHRMIDQDPELGKRISVDVSTRLHHARTRFFELATLSATERVSAELLRMARTIGIENDKLVIRPAPVHSNLALRVNSTRETVSRAVNKLKKSGVVARQPGALVVLKPDELRDSMSSN